MTPTQTLPVRKWYLRLAMIDDESAALEAWRQIVKAQGWSAVGEPEISSDPANPGVIGRVVQHPGLTIDPSVHRVEIPLEKPRWVDLYGIDPDYTGGQPIDEFLAEQRGER